VNFSFGLFLPHFGCHGNYLGSLKNSGSNLNSPTAYTLLYMRKIPTNLANASPPYSGTVVPH